MNARRVEITLSVEMFDRLEQERGYEPRASFIKRVLESALSTGEVVGGDASRAATSASPAAPTRTPKTKGSS